MPKLDLSKDNWQTEALDPAGPTCLVIRAWLEPIGGVDRFQPAGFPEIGHVIYDAPRGDGSKQKVCIVDSPASMANHLETVCTDGPTAGLHDELAGLPFVRCVTDLGGEASKDKKPAQVVVTTLTEGHRLASDYFLDAQIDFAWKAPPKGHGTSTQKKSEPSKPQAPSGKWEGSSFRETLRGEFGIKEVRKDKTYLVWPDAWWKIYQTIFKYDPNSLVHGVMFAKEQIKISRLLTAHLEAYGASRVGRSGVKFDRLGKTTSGQPIFAVEDETADSIIATFIIDLALLRSYGRSDNGLRVAQKRLLLDLAVWKIKRLLSSPFRFRSGCQLTCTRVGWCDDTDDDVMPSKQDGKSPDFNVNIRKSIQESGMTQGVTDVYYPSSELFKVDPADKGEQRSSEDSESEDSPGNDDTGG